MQLRHNVAAQGRSCCFTGLRDKEAVSLRGLQVSEHGAGRGGAAQALPFRFWVGRGQDPDLTPGVLGDGGTRGWDLCVPLVVGVLGRRYRHKQVWS